MFRKLLAFKPNFSGEDNTKEIKRKVSEIINVVNEQADFLNRLQSESKEKAEVSKIDDSEIISKVIKFKLRIENILDLIPLNNIEEINVVNLLNILLDDYGLSEYFHVKILRENYKFGSFKLHVKLMPHTAYADEILEKIDIKESEIFKWN